jgi:Ner family transcriptional regulator
MVLRGPIMARRQWHKEDIKAEIRKRGLTLADLARGHDVAESTVRDALNRPLKRGELIIASFLCKPLHELWPERWTADGQRIRPRYAYKHTGRTAA